MKRAKRIKHIGEIQNTAEHLIAIRAAARNLGCEHLLEERSRQPQTATSAAYSLWSGMADGCTESEAEKAIVSEFNEFLPRSSQ